MNPLNPRTLVTAAATATLLALTAFPAFAAGDPDLVEVDHDCTSIDVSSTKAISNVVLRFADGDTQRFEDLPESRTGTFAGTGEDSGEVIATAWVKSGNNKSGDGPGYGERFDFELDDCEVDSGTTGTSGTTSTSGTTGDDGSQGTDSTTGTKGTKGTTGDDGSQGTDGTNGTNGTQGSEEEPEGPEGPEGPQGPEGDVGSQADQDDVTGDGDAETDPVGADATDQQPAGGQVAAAGAIRDARVLGLVLDRGREDGLRAADASEISSAGLLPNTGADAGTTLATALAALALGAGVLRRTRRAGRAGRGPA